MKRKKSYLTIGVITLTAVVAMTGIYYKDQREKTKTEQEAVVLADAEKKQSTAGRNAETSAQASQKNTEQKQSTEKKSQKEDSTKQDSESASESESVATTSVTVSSDKTAKTAEKQLHFSGKDGIDWPVNGDVILNYSMDQSVYFATLDQYKYNPALVIAGDVSTKVRSVADAKVVSVSNSEETGLTVKTDLGDDYAAIYGQLKNIEVKKGQKISRGEVIGYISEPTKYYSVEGSCLYFAMTKDGKPVNPTQYLRS